MRSRWTAVRYWLVVWLLWLAAAPAFADGELSLDGAPLSPSPAPTASRQPVPTVSILSAKPDKKGMLRVEVEVISPSGGKIELYPKLNGESLDSTAVIADSATDGTAARNLVMPERYTINVPTPTSGAIFEVVARAGAAESEPAEVRLSASGLEQRPTLYLLAVGVGKYKRPEIPALRYPPKDARDLALTLQRQKRWIYRDIETYLLLDENATREQILEGLKWLSKRVSRNDTAVVFLAGHGTNDPEGSYYFLPQDAQVDRQSMLSGQTLQEELHRIAGKVVLMLDTCHSGNVLGRDSFSRLINDLTTQNRVVVFTASTGEQSARESPAWQNGAFTKALIEGLRGVADYADDGEISLSELETWTSLRVRQLTHDVQTPTLAKPNTAPDYVLAALPVKDALLNPKKQVRRKGFIIGAAAVAAAIVASAVIPVALAQSQSQSNVFSISWH